MAGSSSLRRLKPIPATLAALVGLLWAISFGAIRDFIWADLRDGMMDLRGLSRLTRAIILTGFGLLFGTVFILLVNDFLRDRFSLIVLPNAFIYAPGRGMMLPVPLVPLTLFLIAAAWSFALAGAIHSHLAIRLGVLAFFLFSAVRQLFSLLSTILAGLLGVSDLVILGVTLLAILAVVVVFLVLSRLKARPALEFVLLFVLISLIYFTTQLKNVNEYRLTGIPLNLASMQLDIMDFSTIVLPFLLYLGVDIADFTRDSSGWLSRALTKRLPAWALISVFFLFCAWRIYGLVQENLGLLAQTTAGAMALSYLGALGEILMVGLVWLGVRRLQPASRQENLDHEGVAEKVAGPALWVILAFNFTSLVNFAMTSMASAIPAPAFINLVLKASTWLNQTAATWGIIINIAAVILAGWLARRGQVTLPLYLGLFGMLHLYYKITNPGELLGAITWTGPQTVDAWWVALFSLVGVYLMVARKLSAESAGQLFFLLTITFLLRQTAFISNPFSPVFGFAGVGFIAFGVLWDALTSGSWANVNTPGLSRTSRIFLYLGYVILTVTVINWALSTHDLTSLNQLTGNTALVGLDRFGRPMLYAIFALTLSRVLFPPAPPVEVLDQGRMLDQP
jgi:hypothetical protein